ncbi:MAG: hypothetical protein IPG81_14530 [Sandaracinaceae bacterium]|nr:hypothetical protein [Sandaracinaceae bacterium]
MTRFGAALAGVLTVVALAAPLHRVGAQPPPPPQPVPTPIAPPTPTPIAPPTVPPMPTPAPALQPPLAGPTDAGVPMDAGVATDAGPDALADAGARSPQLTPLPEEHRPRLEISVEPREGLSTGDVTTLRLTVHGAPGSDITLPEDQNFGEPTSSVTPAPIELLDSRVRVTVRPDQGQDFHFELDLLLLEPGEHVVGPLRVRVLTADGQVGVVEAEAQRITVASVLGNEPDAQPFPPTTPVSVMEDDDRPYYVMAALGVLLVGLLLGYLLRRYLQKRAQAPKPAPPPLPPWEVAAGELAWLAQTRRKHIEEGQWDAWVDKLSDVLRGYLGARYEFDGLESTSVEILAQLRQRKTDPRLVKRVEELLDACDLVKFANSPAGDEETDQMLASALTMVRETRPLVGASPMPGELVAQAAIPIPDTRVGPSRFRGPVPKPVPDPNVNPDARWMPKMDPEPVAETILAPEDEILPVPKPIVAAVIPATRVGDLDKTLMEPSPFGAARPAEPAPSADASESTDTVEAATSEGSVPTLPGFADDEALELARKAREASKPGGES